MQEMLLNLLLRNYLHYNLYDQAEKLRSKAPRFEAHSNQQVWWFCYSWCQWDLFPMVNTGKGPLIKRVYVRRNDQEQKEMGQEAQDVNTIDVNVNEIGTDIGN